MLGRFERTLSKQAIRSSPCLRYPGSTYFFNYEMTQWKEFYAKKGILEMFSSELQLFQLEQGDHF